MTTYAATTPDGHTRTRTSARVYTHAVAVQERSGAWYIWSFHGSEALAAKTSRSPLVVDPVNWGRVAAIVVPVAILPRAGRPRTAPRA